MPGGSDYPGPSDRLELYRRLVDRHPEAEVKGAKNPYTSRNGWMTSFLAPDGLICLRLGGAERDEALAAGASEVQQYGRNMPDFAALPAELADGDADAWFARSWDHAGTLDPK
ncbi:MAG: hypothetical protein R8F63_12695 [Acidimicrobiales bacterium]|nr:hypothetical protein [Acidimicrobiales bacterium]